VGGPIGAEGAVVVLTVNKQGDLNLEGIAPNTSKVIWTRPYSESVITPGVPATLGIIGNTVLDLAPSAQVNDPIVNLLGINATTGAIEWDGPQNVIVSDDPTTCGADQYFCVDLLNAQNSSNSRWSRAAHGRRTI
jgi:hypothetical protein